MDPQGCYKYRYEDCRDDQNWSIPKAAMQVLVHTVGCVAEKVFENDEEKKQEYEKNINFVKQHLSIAEDSLPWRCSEAEIKLVTEEKLKLSPTSGGAFSFQSVNDPDFLTASGKGLKRKGASGSKTSKAKPGGSAEKTDKDTSGGTKPKDPPPTPQDNKATLDPAKEPLTWASSQEASGQRRLVEILKGRKHKKRKAKKKNPNRVATAKDDRSMSDSELEKQAKAARATLKAIEDQQKAKSAEKQKQTKDVSGTEAEPVKNSDHDLSSGEYSSDDLFATPTQSKSEETELNPNSSESFEPPEEADDSQGKSPRRSSSRLNSKKRSYEDAPDEKEEDDGSEEGDRDEDDDSSDSDEDEKDDDEDDEESDEIECVGVSPGPKPKKVKTEKK